MFKRDKLKKIIEENPGLTVKDLAKKTKSNVDAVYVMIGNLRNKHGISVIQDDGKYFIKKTIAPEIINDVLNSVKTKKDNSKELSVSTIIASFSAPERSQYFMFKEKGQNYIENAESMLNIRKKRLINETEVSSVKSN